MPELPRHTILRDYIIVNANILLQVLTARSYPEQLRMPELPRHALNIGIYIGIGFTDPTAPEISAVPHPEI